MEGQLGREGEPIILGNNHLTEEPTFLVGVGRFTPFHFVQRGTGEAAIHASLEGVVDPRVSSVVAFASAFNSACVAAVKGAPTTLSEEQSSRHDSFVEEQPAAVKGFDFGNGAGVLGVAVGGPGVRGRSFDDESAGVHGTNEGLGEGSAGAGGAGGAGVAGESTFGPGVEAVSDQGVGLRARSRTNNAVRAATGEPSSVLDSTPDAAIWGDCSDAVGVIGTSEVAAGVRGVSATGAGVQGSSQRGTGTEAVSDQGVGLRARSETNNAVRASKGELSSVLDTTPEAAIWGDCKDAEGVMGTSEFAGVRGLSAAGTGVSGQSTSGTGVSGQSKSGSGITGRCDRGTGVRGEGHIGVAGIAAGDSGIGVVADGRGATALDVRGKATFSRSGVATIDASNQAPSNGVSVLIDGLTDDSLVLATLQSDQPDLFVKCAFVIPVAGDPGIQILLNRQTSVPVDVAWFVIN